MAYNGLIPGALDIPANSQPQIQTNFTEIQTLIKIDHADFDTTNQGMHNKVTLPPQIASPLLAANNGFYNVIDSGGTNVSETWTHNQRVGGTVDVPMTASVLSLAAPVQGMSGWTYLPSSILIRWDVQAVVMGPQAIVLPPLPGLAALTTIFSVNITAVGAGLDVQLTAITNNTTIQVNASAAGSIRILTIGN